MARYPRSLAWLALGSLIVLLAVGCGDEVTNIYTDQNRVNVTLTARVISYPSGEPVAGARFALIAPGRTGSADSDGLFSVSDLSTGTYQVVVSAEDHATSRVTIDIDAGYSPPSEYRIHRNIYLIETGATLELTVYSAPEGTVVPSAVVDMVGCGFPQGASGHEIDPSSIHVSGETNAQGVVIFTGMPATLVRMAVRSHDLDGDGIPECETTPGEFELKPGLTTEGAIVLEPYIGGPISVVCTNIVGYCERLESPAVYLIFSCCMNRTQGKTEVTLQHYYGNGIPVTSSWTSPVRLEIRPNQDLSSQNEYCYYLTVEAEGADGSQFSGVYRLYWITTGEPGGGDCDEVVTDLRVTDALESIDYDTRGLYLSWTAVPCAGGYRIYAKDDYDNQDWVYVREEPTDYEYGTISTAFALPSSFDRYQVDGIQTPFAGIGVSVCVVPKNASSPDPGGNHAVVQIVDGKKPSILSVQQSGSGNNDTGERTILEFVVLFSEYVDPSCADPVIEFQEAGGDPGFVLDPWDGEWLWESGRRAGRFSFTLETGDTAGGDLMRVIVEDLTDLSGNVLAGQTATQWASIMESGGKFDFESSVQGWTRTGQGWQWGTPTIGPGGAHGGMRCWGTSLHENYGYNWDTSLWSPEILVPVGSPVLTFWCWYNVDCYDDYCQVYVHVGQSQYSLASFTCSGYQWQKMDYAIGNFAGKVIKLEFRFTSDDYGNYYGFFLDDVEVASP